MHNGDLIAAKVVVAYSLRHSSRRLVGFGGRRVVAGTPNFGPVLSKDGTLPIKAVVEHPLELFL